MEAWQPSPAATPLLPAFALYLKLQLTQLDKLAFWIQLSLCLWASCPGIWRTTHKLQSTSYKCILDNQSSCFPQLHPCWSAYQVLSVLSAGSYSKPVVSSWMFHYTTLSSSFPSSRFHSLDNTTSHHRSPSQPNISLLSQSTLSAACRKPYLSLHVGWACTNANVPDNYVWRHSCSAIWLAFTVRWKLQQLLCRQFTRPLPPLQSGLATRD